MAPLWSKAETENTPAAWDVAADAYAAERRACTTDCLERAYAVVLARKNALSAAPMAKPSENEPTPVLPARERAFIAAVDDYVELGPTAADDLVEMKFLAANLTYRWKQDDAIERLEEVLRIHRYDELAEYSANMLLDALIQKDDIEQMKYWVNELLGDAKFLAGKDAIRATLEMLRERIQQP